VLFQTLSLQADAAFDFAQKVELKPKNRFKNILPCEWWTEQYTLFRSLSSGLFVCSFCLCF